MARPIKQTVDYFPHTCTSGKTLYILESKFGNDGYAFWFKLLEILGSTAGHYFNCRNPASWEFLQAKTHTDEETATNIINLLVELDAIDPELWTQARVIWCQNFVNNVADVYKNRRTDPPPKPSLQEDKLSKAGVSTDENPNTGGVPTEGKRQSKVKETKLKDIRVSTTNNATEENQDLISGQAIEKAKAIARGEFKDIPQRRVAFFKRELKKRGIQI